MKYIKTYENLNKNLKFKKGDQVILLKLRQLQFRGGFKKGEIYTITTANSDGRFYPYYIINSFNKGDSFCDYQLRKATQLEIETSKYNL